MRYQAERRMLLLGLLGLAGGLVGCSSPPPAQAPLPAPAQPAVDSAAPGRLEAAQQVVDLGRVPFERQVEARYELVNTGGGVVRLIGAPKVRTLEGC